MADNPTQVVILTEDMENRIDHGLAVVDNSNCCGAHGPGHSPRANMSVLSPLINMSADVVTSPCSKRNMVQQQRSSMDCGSDGVCVKLRGETLSFLSPCSHLEGRGVKRLKKSLSRSGIQAERKMSSFQWQFPISPCFSEMQEASPVLMPSIFRDPYSPFGDFSEKENISPPPFPKVFNLSETPKPLGDCERAAQREEDSENLFCFANVDNKEESHAVPSSVATLISAPFVCHNEDKKLSETSSQKHLQFRSGSFFRSPSAPTTPSLDMLEQHRHERNEQVPLESCPNHYNCSMAEARPSTMTLPQWEQGIWNGKENSEASISDTAEESAKDLFDSSLTPLLPHAKGERPGLGYITPETLVSALEGAYVEHIDKLLVIDCRYPYEFQGGHIRGAWNLYTKEELQENLLNRRLRPSRPQGRVIIVFHCEFSSERGPRQCHALRQMDRKMNINKYPKVLYPELYVLLGGYREFFSNAPTHCEPQGYRKMYDEAFRAELRYFRNKSRTWTEGQSRFAMCARLKL
uniref:M-phase inducer phosphatase 2-like n=1 Tax=Myxine glutinosa TaxID=7769 RepID=UPI00358E7842